MSRRTSEASKAIREAWENEYQFVLEGKGTRDWTPEQQQSILDKGKVYDDDGKAFEGHHMKSAETYPEYQGDAGNIQFLSRSEHQDAHGGNYRNPTNGYYDPITCETREFDENKYVPCEIIELSDPIASTNNIVQDAVENTKAASSKNADTSETEAESAERVDTTPPRNDLSKKTTDTHKPSNVKPSPKADSSFGDKILHAVEAVKEFGVKHPVLTEVGKWAGAAALTIAAAAASNSGKSKGGSSDYFPFSDSSDDNSSSPASEEYSESSIQRDYPDERSSPREHEVSGHYQHYGKNKDLKWVDSYPRGGDKDE
jgi:hypothetical protein